MPRLNARLLFTVLLLSGSVPAMAGSDPAVEWTYDIVLKARYGEGADRFPNDEGQLLAAGTVNTPVRCFNLTPDAMLIVSTVLGDVKIFGYDGAFIDAFTPGHEKGDTSVGVIPIVDITFFEDNVFLLAQYRRHPMFELWRCGLDGKIDGRYRLGQDFSEKASQWSHRYRLSRHGGDIYMFDRIKHGRHLVLQNGQPTEASVQSAYADGEIIADGGIHSVYFDRQSGDIHLTDPAGNTQTVAGKGLVAVSEFGGFFAVMEDAGLARGTSLSNIVVYRSDGHAIGKLQRPMSAHDRLKLSLAYRNPLEPFRFGPDGALYQLLSLKEGVFVLKWEPGT